VSQFNSTHERNFKEKSELISSVIDKEISTLNSIYVNRLIGFVNSNPDLVEAFANYDRDALYNLAFGKYKILVKENPQFHGIVFLTPDRHVFLRMNKPDYYSDDMSKVAYVKDLFDRNKVYGGIVYFEGGMYYKTGIPVYHNEKFVGAVVFCVDISQIGVTIKQYFNSDYGIYARENEKMEPVGMHRQGSYYLGASSSNFFLKLPPELNIALPTQKVVINEKHIYLISKPLVSYDNQELGVICIALDTTQLVHEHHVNIIRILVITFFLILFSIFVLYLSFSSMIGRLDVLNKSLESRVEERTSELQKTTKRLEMEATEHRQTSARLYKANEDAIKQHELISSLYQRFKNMFLDHQAVMLVYDPVTGKIIDSNMAASEFFSKDRDELIKMNINDFGAMTDGLLSRSERNMSKSIVAKYCAEGIRDRYIEIHSSPVRFEKGVYQFAILHDVTDKIRYEKELKELNNNLETRIQQETWRRREQEQLLIQQSKMSAAGEMLAAILHQWRQPMSALSGLLQDLDDAVEYGEADMDYVRTSVDKSMEQIKYMSQTIDDFKSFLFPSREKINFSLKSMTRQTIKIVAPQLIKDNISIILRCERVLEQNRDGECEDCDTADLEKCPYSVAFIKGYLNEMKQVLLNVIHNAREAIVDNCEKTDGLRGKIFITFGRKDGFVLISVEDTAGGVPEEAMPKIFEPYFTTKDNRGTGIGLYMSKSIIESHMGGTLSVENTDRGALFTIMLPEFIV
jgi:PAS domain S-box-containing protein